MMRPQRVTNRLIDGVAVFFSGARISMEVVMKKWLIGIGLLLIFAVDWAALHDIIKGEQDVWMEWTFVIASLILLAITISRWLALNIERKP